MNIEEIYNQSLEMLKAGKTEQEILARFKDFQNELAPLLRIGNDLFSMPINTVPTPLMQRKYAVTTESFWFSRWMLLSRFSTASIGFMLLLATLFGVGYAANQSSPGDKFFALKKGGEKIQLILAGNRDARASFEIHIAQKRLDEAQVVLTNPESNPEQKTAALTELSNQTTVAIAEVSTATKNNPKSQQNHPLIASLDSIAKQQQTLLKQIQPDDKIQNATNKALASLTASAAQISEIKNTIAVADSDQILAGLNPAPDSVAVLGQVTKISDSQITVEKITFIITAQTIIQNLQGITLNSHDLLIGQKINISGVKNNNSITAKFIVVISKGSVEGAATTTPGTTTPAEVSLKKAEPAVTAESSVQKANSASGTFILEDPAPQFAN